MRRKDREIKDFSKIAQIIRELSIGHLAMIDGDQPYGVTMNYDAEIEDGIVTLYFHGAKEGRRPEIWKRNPAVYFFAERDDGEKDVVMPNGRRNQTTYYVSVAGSGVMEEITDLAEKRKRLAAMVAKFFPTPMDALPDAMIQAVGVWKLILRNPTGKSNPPC